MSLHRIRRAAAGLGGVGDGGSGGAAFRASAESSSNSTASLAVTMPTNSADDRIVVWIYTDSNSFSSPITAPAGWTKVDDNTGNVCGLYIKTSSGSESASYTWTLNTSAEVSAIAVSFSGCTGNTTATIADSTTTNSITMPSDGLVVAFYGEEANRTPTAPAGLTEVATGSVKTNNTTSIGYYGPASTGTVSGKTVGGMGASTDSVMVGLY